jgi:hypothetical protein
LCDLATVIFCGKNCPVIRAGNFYPIALKEISKKKRNYK